MLPNIRADPTPRGPPAMAPSRSAPVPHPAPRRILLVRLSHLGDVVHGWPVFHAVRRCWPAAQVAWVVESSFAGAVEGLPGLDRVLRFERRGGLRAWWRLRQDLRRFRPDLGLDLQGNSKSAAVLLASGATRRLGLHPRDWREPWGAVLLHDHPEPCPGDPPHAVDRMAHLATWLTGDPSPPRLDGGLDAGEREAARARLAQWFGLRSRPVVLQLGRAQDPRSWPVHLAVRGVRSWVDAGWQVLVLAGPAEEPVAEQFAAASTPAPGRWHLHRARGGPRESLALLAAVAEQGGVYVGSDSGPLHLAAAAGLPTLLLAGPQDPQRTGAFPPPDRAGSPHRVLSAEPGPPCRPCRARHCHHPQGPVCMSGIEPEQVLRALG
jgi:heptosyltransferase-1